LNLVGFFRFPVKPERFTATGPRRFQPIGREKNLNRVRRAEERKRKTKKSSTGVYRGEEKKGNPRPNPGVGYREEEKEAPKILGRCWPRRARHAGARDIPGRVRAGGRVPHGEKNQVKVRETF